jgi:hypothetical protein
MTAGQTPIGNTVTEKLLTQLKSLTENNLHGEAYQVAAQALGQQALHDQFARIERDRVRIGHLPHDLNQERYAAYTELMQVAKRRLFPAAYDRFYMCF